jgi:hypothetical protein
MRIFLKKISKSLQELADDVQMQEWLDFHNIEDFDIDLFKCADTQQARIAVCIKFVNYSYMFRISVANEHNFLLQVSLRKNDGTDVNINDYSKLDVKKVKDLEKSLNDAYNSIFIFNSNEILKLTNDLSLLTGNLFSQEETNVIRRISIVFVELYESILLSSGKMVHVVISLVYFMSHCKNIIQNNAWVEVSEKNVYDLLLQKLYISYFAQMHGIEAAKKKYVDMYLISSTPLIYKNSHDRGEYQCIIKAHFDLLCKKEQTMHLVPEFLKEKARIDALQSNICEISALQCCLHNVVDLMCRIRNALYQEHQESIIILIKDLAYLIALEADSLFLNLLREKQMISIHSAFQVLDFILCSIAETKIAPITNIIFATLQLVLHDEGSSSDLYRVFVSKVTNLVCKLRRQGVSFLKSVAEVCLHNIEKKILDTYSIFKMYYLSDMLTYYCLLYRASENRGAINVNFMRLIIEKHLDSYGKCIEKANSSVFLSWMFFSRRIVFEYNKLTMLNCLFDQKYFSQDVRDELMYFVEILTKKILIHSKHRKKRFLKICFLDFIGNMNSVLFDEKVLRSTVRIVNDIRKKSDPMKMSEPYLLWTVNIFLVARNKIFIVSSVNRSSSAMMAHSLLDNFYRHIVTYFVENHMFFLMRHGKQEKMNKIFKLLSTEVKNDIFFLEKIAQYYQDAVFFDNKEIEDKNFALSLKQRFSCLPVIREIQQIDIKKYDSNGNIVVPENGVKETKFDTASFICGEKTNIIRLEMDCGRGEMIAGMAKEIFLNDYECGGNIFLVGLFASSGMKNKLSHDGKINKTWLPMIAKQELFHNRIGEILLYHVRLKELYYYVLSMIDPQPANTVCISGKVLAGSFNVICLHDNHLKIPLNACEQNFCITNCDGAGFIKRSVINRFADLVSQAEPYSTKAPTYSYRNVHHINRHIVGDEIYSKAINESVKEGIKRINTIVKHNLSYKREKIAMKTLYHTFTTGYRTGESNNLIAIPVAGDKVIFPGALEPNTGITIGRPPFDKHTSNIPLLAEDVVHERSDDHEVAACAASLKKLYGFQYRFTGADDYGKIHFFKGVMIIIEDKIINDLYPNYKYVDMFLNCSDKKVCSDWSVFRQLPKHGEELTVYGVLTPSSIYGPKTFIGIPNIMQKESLGGDYDGDVIVATMFAPNSYFFSMIKTSFEYYKSQDYENAKILKQFTPTIDGEQVSLFRFSNIIQATENSYLKGYTDCYNIFTILKADHKVLICNGIFSLINVRNLLELILNKKIQNSLSQEEKEQLIMMVLSKGIRSGTDVYKTMIDWRLLKEFFHWFIFFLKLLNIPKDVVYFKKLSISLHNGVIDVNDILEKINMQKMFFECFPLDMLEQSLLHVIGKSKIMFDVFMRKRMLETFDMVNTISCDPKGVQFYSLIASLIEKARNIPPMHNSQPTATIEEQFNDVVAINKEKKDVLYAIVDNKPKVPSITFFDVNVIETKMHQKIRQLQAELCQSELNKLKAKMRQPKSALSKWINPPIPPLRPLPSININQAALNSLTASVNSEVSRFTTMQIAKRLPWYLRRFRFR